MTDRIVQTLRDLGQLANTLTPHRIASRSMEPVEGDAEDFNSDLLLIARKVDAVIEAYGEYLQSHGIVSKGDVDDCFRLQLETALDGNATFLIKSGVDDRLEHIADEAADHKREMMRKPV